MHVGITAHSLQAGPSASDEVLADNPIVFWELDTALGVGGTFTLDSGPNGFIGQVTGHERDGFDAELTSGAPAPPGTPNGKPGLVNDGGTCYDFPGPDTGGPYAGGYLIELAVNDTKLISHMSIECWINLDTFSGGIGAVNGRNYIVSSSDPFATSGNSAYNTLWSLYVSATGKLGVLWENGIRNKIITESTHSITTNNTHHIVVTRNGAAKTVTFWDNGVEYDTVAYSDNPTGGSQTRMRVAYVSTDSFSRMNGEIDNIAIYNYSLPDARIIAHYNSGI